ncbi:hypothetical protein HO133_004172 [Letharia lupina]|uniref:Uncharacterized protein n=1 Tax=Letharia lupina TaxID=560253 RepID=A0A8H6FJV6_9LECA|nr:uncharacterized protein HO133_004172 [Letharia lupina]KAF6229835.1 hypothetical protein HO133_004172 [Letharia lupina]
MGPVDRSQYDSLTTVPGEALVTLVGIYKRTSYENSDVASLAISNDCAAQGGQDAVLATVACNITVTGYKAGSSSPYTTQNFQFTSEEPVDVMSPLAFGTFLVKFQNLQDVTLAVEPPLLTSAHGSCLTKTEENDDVRF